MWSAKSPGLVNHHGTEQKASLSTLTYPQAQPVRIGGYSAAIAVGIVGGAAAFLSVFLLAFLAPLLVWPTSGLITGVVGATASKSRVLLPGIVGNATATVVAFAAAQVFNLAAGDRSPWHHSSPVDALLAVLVVAAMFVVPGLIGGAGVWFWRYLRTPLPSVEQG